ncbi:MAG: GntR family transcriptional regulator, partial [Terriglobia bacterium]
IRRHGHTGALLEDIHRRHSEVVRAIAEQNPERAMRAMAEHIQLSLRERLDDFDHGEIESSLRETFPSSLDTRSLLLTGNFRDSRRTD